ncbi:MAG: hypothetical protein IPH82_30140 [Chloroflexi bacterium]|nr:hypothetical protein [Chloroflexota bacterium]
MPPLWGGGAHGGTRQLPAQAQRPGAGLVDSSAPLALPGLSAHDQLPAQLSSFPATIWGA